MTKKKTILEEGTIRRFMRLANLNPLSENYCGEEEIQEEEDEELAVDAVDDAEPADIDVEEAPAEEETAVSAEVATELVAAIADAVEDVTGVPVEVTGAEEAPMEEPEMDMEPEMEEPAEDAEAYRKEEAETPCGDVVAEEEVESPCADVVAEEEETEEEVVSEEEETEEEVVSEDEGPQTITNEELVNYISQRVAKRLEEKKKV